jgi:polyisoprenoid-binding protein YceI
MPFMKILGRGLVLILALAALVPARLAGRIQADPTEWTVDSLNSQAQFAVRHMLVSTVRGQLGPITGKIWYDGTNVSSIRAQAAIDVKGLTTGNKDRDAHLRSDDFFAADKYPTITFKSKRVEPAQAGHFKLIGDLTIRSTTKEVTLDVAGPAPIVTAQGLRRTAATATLTLNRFDYGLKWNDLIELGGGAVVSSDVNITIDLEITRKPS